MSFPSESDMMSKELQNSDLIYVNLMTDVFKIIVKYRRKIIAKYRHLLPSGNQALEYDAYLRSGAYWRKYGKTNMQKTLKSTLTQI